MAKRVSLSERRSNDARGGGVGVLFGKKEPSAPAAPVEQEVVAAPAPTVVVAEAQPEPNQVEQKQVNEESAAKAQVAKVTLYVRPDQIEAVEEIQLKVRKATGKRPDKSALVQEAFDLLIEKYRKL